MRYWAATTVILVGAACAPSVLSCDQGCPSGTVCDQPLNLCRVEDPDAGMQDAGSLPLGDSGTSGAEDAGTDDGGDAGGPDSGRGDAGLADAGVADAGVRDAGIRLGPNVGWIASGGRATSSQYRMEAQIGPVGAQGTSTGPNWKLTTENP